MEVRLTHQCLALVDQMFPASLLAFGVGDIRYIVLGSEYLREQSLAQNMTAIASIRSQCTSDFGAGNRTASDQETSRTQAPKQL